MLKPARGPRARRAGAVSDRRGRASERRVAGNATRIDLCDACHDHGADIKIVYLHLSKSSAVLLGLNSHHSLGSAIVVSASTSASMSSSLCAAESARRTRLVPRGTVGGRIAGAWRP